MQIVDRSDNEQTFVANIHGLLNDAFFLNNTMRAFAYDRIKIIADDLLHLQGDLTSRILRDKFRTDLPILKMIGEALIQNKLICIYYGCFPEMRPSIITESHKQLLNLQQELESFPPVCPYYQMDGYSKCPGCSGEGFMTKHPTCGVLSCSQRKGLEYCYLCDEYP